MDFIWKGKVNKNSQIQVVFLFSPFFLQHEYIFCDLNQILKF